MNSDYSSLPVEEPIFQRRFLILCLAEIRRTGQCSYPPLVQLIEQYKAAGTSFSELFQNEQLQLIKPQVLTSQKTVIAAAQHLQTLSSWTCSTQIQEKIQVIAQETQKLERLLQPLYPPDSHGESALKRLCYLRDYLLQKLSDAHFLSPYGLRSEQPIVFFYQHRRVHKYLNQLRAVTNELLELL